MLKRSLILIALAIMATPAMAQTSFYTDRALQQVNVLTSPTPLTAAIPYGSVRVCGLPLTQAQPCLPLASITDINGNAISNAIGPLFGQLTTDATGRFTFGCTLGNNYQVQVTQSASNTPAVNYPITCPGVGSSPQFTNITASGPATFNGGLTTTTTTSTGAGSHSGAEAFTGALTNCQLNGVLYVPGAAGCWSGSDIGAQLNTAYASCAANSLCHIMLTNSGPLNFSTGINFNVSGKYVLMEAMFPCVVNNATAIGGCLNFTPTSGLALEMDYVPTTAGIFPTAHGLKNVGLINNSCFTSGGCGGTAFGLDYGGTNHGMANATLDTISIIGFNFGYNVSNTNNLPGVFFKNAHFQNNNIAMIIGNQTGNIWQGGLFIANQTDLQAPVAVGGEYTFIGTGMSTNTSGPMFDFTRNTTRAFFTCTACHFEDSAAASGVTDHYLQGLVEARIYGGVMETDQTSGTQDWFVSISAGGAIEVHGLEMTSGGKTFTQAFLLNTTARGNIQATLFTPALFPTVCGGAGCAGSSILTISANANAVQTLNGFNVTRTIQASGTAIMTTAAIAAGACGTTVTVANGNILSTDTIVATFNAAPTGTNAGLTTWVTTGNANFAYCPGVAETPAAATINWQVFR